MTRKKRPALKPTDYLHFFLSVVEILTPAGASRAQLSRYELDMLNDAAERQETPASFAQWIRKTRAEPRFGPYDERDAMGDETVSIVDATMLEVA